MEDQTKAYYTTSDKGKRIFVYARIDLDKANKLFSPLRRGEVDRDTKTEIHITTDTCFDRYIHKRLVAPRMVKICENMLELDSLLSQVGVYL